MREVGRTAAGVWCLRRVLPDGQARYARLSFFQNLSRIYLPKGTHDMDGRRATREVGRSPNGPPRAPPPYAPPPLFLARGAPRPAVTTGGITHPPPAPPPTHPHPHPHPPPPPYPGCSGGSVCPSPAAVSARTRSPTPGRAHRPPRARLFVAI